jgi:TRAP-type uncharacterized transport system fused permease subunit
MAVVVGGPVLMEFGLPALSVHMFVFYYAILSAVTPPICGAVFIASGMADANWLGTARISLKLSFAAFLVPFLFVYDPALLLMGSAGDIAVTLGKTLAAVLFLSAGLMSFWRVRLSFPARVLMITAGILMIRPPGIETLVGLAVAVFLAVRPLQKR